MKHSFGGKYLIGDVSDPGLSTGTKEIVENCSRRVTTETV